VRLQPDGQERALAAGMGDVAVVDPVAAGVEDANRAEVALHGLVEAQHDLRRLGPRGRAAIGGRGLQRGVRERARRQGERQQRDE
jgi:hypothetical protein